MTDTDDASPTTHGAAITPETLATLARRQQRVTEALRARRVAEIVAALGEVAERWLDPRDLFRREAQERLPETTGYAPFSIQMALDHLFEGLRARQLWELLRAELGDPDTLDRFVPRGGLLETGARLRALGPRLTLIWASGNIPVAAVPSLFHALLVKSACLVKTSAAEPLLLTLIARSVAETVPWLGEAIAARCWPGKDEALGRAALQHTEAVIAYGRAETLAALRRWAPPEARFRACGPRVGFGVIGRERMTAAALEELADRAARDVALFDQQGCMSPHLLYVEEGGELPGRVLAERLAAALARWEARAPRRSLTPAEAAAIHQLRAAYEMRALTRRDVALFASPGSTAWTVLLDPEPEFSASCLNRTVFVRPITEVTCLPDLLALLLASYPSGSLLQTVVADLDAPRLEELAERLAPLGVTRIAPLGRAQEPCLVAPHDGYPRLADLVRWTTLEQGASSAPAISRR